jgi:hypothetical protein
MIITIIIVACAAAVALFLLSAARGRSVPIERPQDIAAFTAPVHLPALLNLIDDGQEAYLRERLSPAEFRSIRRQRVQVALAYLGRISANTAILQRLAELARRSADAQVALAGTQLAALALQTRLYVFLVKIRLLDRWVMVRNLRPIQRAAGKYAAVVEHVELILRCECPAQAQRIAACL